MTERHAKAVVTMNRAWGDRQRRRFDQHMRRVVVIAGLATLPAFFRSRCVDGAVQASRY